jgi:hypothetical protein
VASAVVAVVVAAEASADRGLCRGRAAAQEEQEVEKGKEGFLRRDEPTTTLTALIANDDDALVVVLEEGRPTAIAAAGARAPRSARAGLIAAGLSVREEATASILQGRFDDGKKDFGPVERESEEESSRPNEGEKGRR